MWEITQLTKKYSNLHKISEEGYKVISKLILGTRMMSNYL